MSSLIPACRRLAGAVAVIAGAASITSCAPHHVPEPGTLRVAASFYPLWYFAEQIAGTHASVFNVTPAGVEPHDYEPTARDLTRLETASVIVINGAGFEPWAGKVRASLASRRTRVVAVSEDLATLRLGDRELAADPHVWLAPLAARQIVDRIAQSFAEVDAANAKQYLLAGHEIGLRLAALDAEFRKGLASCGSRTLTTSHAAFGYLAAAYGLVQTPIMGLSPDDQPSPRQLADIVQFARAHGVTTIFVEPLASTRFAQTVATEIGGTIRTLDPIEGLSRQDAADGADYFSVMDRNLATLRTVLQCTS